MSALNLARFDLLSIRLALDCARTGRLTLAAEQSHIALAAASRRLRELEAAFGSPLFSRHAQGLTLTGAGHVFVKHALGVLHGVEALHSELTDLRVGVGRHIRLCAGTAAINQFLPPLLAHHARLHPQIRIDLDEQVSQVVVARLREGLADIGIFVEGPDTSGLVTRVFRHDELVLLLPPRHRLGRGRGALLFEDLLEEDWISLNTGAAVLVKQQEAALAAGQPLRLRVQVRSFDAVCHMVAAGLGIALLPRAAVLPLARSMKLTMRALRNDWARRRLLLATPSGSADPVIATIVDYLAQSELPSALLPPSSQRSQVSPGPVMKTSQNAKTRVRNRQ